MPTGHYSIPCLSPQARQMALAVALVTEYRGEESWLEMPALSEQVEVIAESSPLHPPPLPPPPPPPPRDSGMLERRGLLYALTSRRVQEQTGTVPDEIWCYPAFHFISFSIIRPNIHYPHISGAHLASLSWRTLIPHASQRSAKCKSPKQAPSQTNPPECHSF